MSESYPVFTGRPAPHPLYEDRNIRAIFRPQDIQGLNPGTKQMVGHEFVWRHIGFSKRVAIWMPADPEDIDNYFELVGEPFPGWKCLWILEDDLDVLGVAKLDA